MARSKLLVFFALILLISIPAGLAQAQSTSGTAVISDGNTQSDRLTISLMDVPDPGDGMALVAWLVSDDDSVKLNVGALTVGSTGAVNHDYLSPSGENLIATYNKAVVTAETQANAGAAEPAGEEAFSAGVSSAAMMHIRNLLVMFPEDGEMGILSNLRAQLEVAIAHVELGRSADDLDGLMMHIQHVINVIEGADGANFSSSGGNPGDGTGVLGHAMGRDQAAMAAAAGGKLVQEKAVLVEEYAGNAEMWATEARDNALGVMDETNLLRAQNILSTVAGPLNSALNGIAATGAGGASQAYVEAQLMATYDFAAGVPVEPVVEPVEIVVGDTDLRILAQVGLIAAVALLLSGSIALAKARRRSRG